MTLEYEREIDGVLYYVPVLVVISGEEIFATVAEDVEEREITGEDHGTGQAIEERTGCLAFAKGEEFELTPKEEAWLMGEKMPRAKQKAA